MRQMVGTSLTFVVAAFVPAIYFGVLGKSFSVGILAFVLGSLWIAPLGLPVFFLLKRLNLVRWWSVVISGFLSAALPWAFVYWPYRPNAGYGYSAWDGHKMVDYLVHGVPTHEGWVQYFHECCDIGFMGAASAIAFWAIWRLTVVPNHSFKADASGAA